MSATGERYGDGRRAYRCDTCGLVSPWTSTWAWYGSHAEDDCGVAVPTYCSKQCTPVEPPKRPDFKFRFTAAGVEIVGKGRQ